MVAIASRLDQHDAGAAASDSLKPLMRRDGGDVGAG